jgi:hypothetical protein
MSLSLDATPLIERLCDAVSKRREVGRQICKDALDCIRNEKSNFERIVAKKPYGKEPLEPRARTQYSFEEMAKAMNKLSRVRKFRAAAKKVACLCEQELTRPADEREAVELLALINELEPRLERRIQNISAKDAGAAPF